MKTSEAILRFFVFIIMNIIKIINEEIGLLIESQTFNVYTQQNDDNFLNKNIPIYFSNDPNYWSWGKNAYSAVIIGNNILNMYDLEKQVGAPRDNSGLYDIHNNVIKDILKLKNGGNINTLESTLYHILAYAWEKGGEKLYNDIMGKIKKADLIIGQEAGDTVTTYVTLTPENIKAVKKL